MLHRALLALALCAAVAAAAAPANCSAAHEAEGWTQIASDVSVLLTNRTVDVVKQYTDMVKALPNQFACGENGQEVAWEACQQSDRFCVHVNLTCPDTANRTVTVTLRADLIKNSRGELDVINVDDDAVFVDGKYVGNDVEVVIDDTIQAAIASGDKATLEQLTATAKQLNNIDDDLDDKFDDDKDGIDRND